MSMTRRDLLKVGGLGLSAWLMPGAAAVFGAARAGRRPSCVKVNPIPFTLPEGYKSQFAEVWECYRQQMKARRP